jgi:hypothetical protein
MSLSRVVACSEVFRSASGLQLTSTCSKGRVVGGIEQQKTTKAYEEWSGEWRVLLKRKKKKPNFTAVANMKKVRIED